MSGKNKRLFFINGLGVAGYFTLVLQWMWLLVAALPAILGSSLFQFFVPDTSTSTPRPVPHGYGQTEAGGSGLFLIVAVLIVAVVICLTIYALRRAPKTIGETGHKITQAAAVRIVPVLTHHEQIPVTKRRFLTARIAFYIKLVFIVAPIIGAYLLTPSLLGISREIVLLVESLLAGVSLGLFCLQVGLAKAMRIDLSRLW